MPSAADVRADRRSPPRLAHRAIPYARPSKAASEPLRGMANQRKRSVAASSSRTVGRRSAAAGARSSSQHPGRKDGDPSPGDHDPDALDQPVTPVKGVRALKPMIRTRNPTASTAPVIAEYAAHRGSRQVQKRRANTKQASGSIVNPTSETTSWMTACVVGSTGGAVLGGNPALGSVVNAPAPRIASAKIARNRGPSALGVPRSRRALARRRANPS